MNRDLGVWPSEDCALVLIDYFKEVDNGGHFAAWEEPDLFASEVRAAFGSSAR